MPISISAGTVPGIAECALEKGSIFHAVFLKIKQQAVLSAGLIPYRIFTLLSIQEEQQ
jgi:hypothetical protein